MRLSYSQIEWFLRCPYVYKCLFIDKERIPKNKEAAFGGILHEVMEYIYKNKPFIPTLTESLQFYEKQWQSGNLFPLFTNEEQENVYFKEGLSIIKDYYGQNNIEETDVLSVERFFEVPVEDRERGELHLLTGRIDRIDKTKNGIEIIDYKTSKVLKTNREVTRDLQLALYYLGVWHLWPDLIERYSDNVRVSLYFLRHGENISVKKTKEELEKTKEELLNYIRHIEDAIKTNSFEAKPSPLCAKEPYSRLCPFFKDQYRTQKPPLPNKQEVSEAVKGYVQLKEQEKSLKQQIAALNKIIHFYLDGEGLEGIYDGELGIARSQSPLYEIDIAALKMVLESLGRWEDVLEVSSAKLAKIARELPIEYRKKIEEVKKIKGINRSLRIKRLP